MSDRIDERTDAASELDGPRPDAAGLDVRGAPLERAQPAASVMVPERQAEPAGEPIELLDDDEAGPAHPPQQSPWLRAGERIVRRPVRWARRPWDTERLIKVTATAVSLVVTTLVMMRVAQFWPLEASGVWTRPWTWRLELFGQSDLILNDNTPNGGDMGAHVWGPAYLRDTLLPNGQLNGWTMDWYAGMPAYRFYMVLPALAIVALDAVLAYGVAFKLVAVSGLVTFPIACWAFGRLARFRYPIPEVFAFAALCFALDESFEIYGGNLKSTMAGEFSFSIALTLTMLGLGLLANGLETGRYRVWAAVVLAAASVSHGIVLIYVAVAALAFSLVWVVVTYRSSGSAESRRIGGALMAGGWGGAALVIGATLLGVDVPLALPLSVLLVAAAIVGAYLFGASSTRRRTWYAISTGVTMGLLSLWWAGPFVFNHDFMTDMKYEPRPSGAEDSFWDMFFPQTTVLDVLITSLAIVGLISLVARRHLTGVAMGVISFVFAALVYATRDSLPGIGLLWNPRVLPFLYLMRYLLMAVGAVELLSVLVNMARNRPSSSWPGVAHGTAMLAAFGLAVLLTFGFIFEVLPGGSHVTKHGETVYAWGPFAKDGPGYDALGDGWSRYNFSGYENKDAYPEYRHVVQTMDDLGEERGCGRAFWEHAEGNGSYGSPMALMLLPFWTDGCIGSMEGLFFEASGTTPYHFLATAAMSESASNPVRKLRYSGLDASVGVPELQSLGVRYVMLRTDAAKAEATSNDGLRQVARSGPWTIYELGDTAVVEPLDIQPVVVRHRDGDPRERNLELGTSWFQNRQDWRAMPANGGPEEWQRIRVRVDRSLRSDNDDDGELDQVDVVRPRNRIRQRVLDPVTVSDVDLQDQSLSFRVDEPGVPVLVKVSYFPNWAARGAEGPWRIGPNMMVVVPTDNEVTLEFTQSKRDYLFYALTLLGIALCVVWRKRGDVVLETPGRPTDGDAGDAGPDRQPAWGRWDGPGGQGEGGASGGDPVDPPSVPSR